MSESTMNLINAIQAGDAVGIESAFNSAMAEKVAERLDDMRTNVAQNMFKTFEQSADAASADTETAPE
jgi:hypothetical protein